MPDTLSADKKVGMIKNVMDGYGSLPKGNVQNPHAAIRVSNLSNSIGLKKRSEIMPLH